MFALRTRFPALQRCDRRMTRWKVAAILSILLLSGCLISLLALPTVALPPTILAQAPQSLEELRDRQKEVEQQRTDIGEQQQQINQQEQSSQQQLGGLRHQITATSEQIAETEQKLQTANQRLISIEKNLTKAERDYQAKQSSTTARLRFLQRQKIGQGWAVLLQSQSINEFLDRRYELRKVYQSDRQILQQLKTDSDQIEQQRQDLALQKNEIVLLRQQLLAQKAEYQAEAKIQEETIKQLRQDRRALEAAEDQLAKDSENLAALIQQRVAEQANKAIVRGTGLMGFPNDGPISSGFGYRIHPLLGYSRFHDGLDFAADYGSPIRSAHDGVVIFAGWYGGYGQTVVIDHGGHVTTLYGHTSEIYVSEGQTVKRGQTIAAVGSTGLSTGPHLHFEVRLAGQPVDPAEYL